MVVRWKYKNGRGGWTQYELPEIIFQEILNSEIRTNLGQTKDNPKTKLRTELRTSPSSSSSSSSINININTTTTTTGLPPEWQAIDLTELHKRNINFNQGHLASLWPFLGPHSSVDFQDSINGLAYDLDHGHLKPDKGGYTPPPITQAPPRGK